MRAQDLMAKAAQAVASAKVLLATGDADAACNRAYYAMFDAARAALMASGAEIGKTHKGVLNAFSERLVKNGPVPREMGRLLKHAETFRYVADYGSDPVELSDAGELVDLRCRHAGGDDFEGRRRQDRGTRDATRALMRSAVSRIAQQPGSRWHEKRLGDAAQTIARSTRCTNA